jgi:hypothetical protein
MSLMFLEINLVAIKLTCAANNFKFTFLLAQKLILVF